MPLPYPTGCFVPDQSRLARWVLRQDRGKSVRQRHEYERLAATNFSKLDTTSATTCSVSLTLISSCAARIE